MRKVPRNLHTGMKPETSRLVTCPGNKSSATWWTSGRQAGGCLATMYMPKAHGSPTLPNSAGCPAPLGARLTAALAKAAEPPPGTYLPGWQGGKWTLFFNGSPMFGG